MASTKPDVHIVLYSLNLVHSCLGSVLSSFKGNMYNLRLWDRAMTVQELNALTCDMLGNVIDWDNNQWTISSSLAQTDNTLSCSE